jgi:hypothetical protein
VNKSRVTWFSGLPSQGSQYRWPPANLSSLKRVSNSMEVEQIRGAGLTHGWHRILMTINVHDT